jgi:hypothetical protein
MKRLFQPKFNINIKTIFKKKVYHKNNFNVLFSNNLWKFNFSNYLDHLDISNKIYLAIYL